MPTLMGFVVACPFAGFLVLAFLGRRLPRALAAAVGVGAVGLSAAGALALAGAYLASGVDVVRTTLWRW